MNAPAYFLLARIDVKVKVNAMPRANYFPKIQNRDTSFYMLGWGVPTFDSQYAVQSLMRTRIDKTADGDYNLGRYSNPKVDKLLQSKMKAGTNQVYAGSSNAAANDLAAGDVITSQLIRYAGTKFETLGVEPVYPDGTYAAVIHPHQELTIRTETGAGGWRVPQEYGASQSRIWNGTIGQYENFTFTVNPRVDVTANSVPVNVYKSYFLGATALAEAVNVEPEIRLAPVVDRLWRNQGIGWYGDLDFAVFEQSALINVNSTLTAADATALA